MAIKVSFDRRNTWLGRTLSNLAFSPFRLFGDTYTSTEGFWQGLKWPAGSVERDTCFGEFGHDARKLGGRAPKAEQFIFRGTVYQVGSEEHLQLMKCALRAKIEQNEPLRRAVVESGDEEFIHPVREKRSAVLTAERFCRMLTEIRSELQGVNVGRET